MVTIYFYTITSVVIVSLISFIGIITLSLKEEILKRTVFVLVSLSVGALMGDAFIHLIPKAMQGALPTPLVSLLIIAGILVFLIIEKFLHWHHYHGKEEEEVHKELHKPLAQKDIDKQIHPMGRMVLISDGFHNFIDGIVIGASYLISIEIGIATTIAIIMHEIPQEIGDFGILLHAGFSKAQALFFNFLSALTSVVGALIALLLGGSMEILVDWMIPIAAGGLIYIALADLIPEIHKTKEFGRSLIQLVAIIVGILAMLLLLLVDM